MKVYWIFLLTALKCLHAQVPLQQSMQLPLHELPALAGSGEKHRLSAGIMTGINTDVFKGTQYLIGYDQRIRSFGVGIFGSVGVQQINPVPEETQTFIKPGIPWFFEKKSDFRSFGFIIAPKFNFTQYAKPRFTLSPALFVEVKRTHANVLNQFRNSEYRIYSGTTVEPTGMQILELVKHDADIRETRLGLNVVFNGPSYYLSAGVSALQRLSFDNGEVYSFGDNGNYSKKSFSAESTNTWISLLAGGGVSIPMKKQTDYALTLGYLSNVSFPANYFAPAQNAFYPLEESVSYKLKIQHSNASAILRYKKLLLGFGISQLDDAINSGFSTGIQTRRYRILTGYNVFKKTAYAGSLEITIQYRF